MFGITGKRFDGVFYNSEVTALRRCTLKLLNI